MKNERGAGRKPAFDKREQEEIRRQHDSGKSVTQLAQKYRVSRQTLSKYLNPKEQEEPAFLQMEEIYRTYSKWQKLNSCFGVENVADYTLRMDFMNGEECCTHLLIDCRRKKILIQNTTDVLLHRAFGVKPKPNWQDFEFFLEERCFPGTRAHLRLVLQDIGVDSYDPLAIVEKTKGRMAEDNQWLRIIHYQPDEISV